MKTTDKYKFVIITWEDSVGCSAGWKPIEDIDQHVIVLISSGFVLKETKTDITLCPHISYDDEADFAHYQGMGIITIPKSAIRNRRNETISF